VIAELERIRALVEAVDPSQPLDYNTVEGRMLANIGMYKNEIDLVIRPPASEEKLQELVD
jgi:hypothetical protein